MFDPFNISCRSDLWFQTSQKCRFATAQLDPIAAERFLDILKKINEDFGITVIISEHRLQIKSVHSAAVTLPFRSFSTYLCMPSKF